MKMLNKKERMAIMLSKNFTGTNMDSYAIACLQTQVIQMLEKIETEYKIKIEDKNGLQ